MEARVAGLGVGNIQLKKINLRSLVTSNCSAVTEWEQSPLSQISMEANGTHQKAKKGPFL